jgi:rhodanese-related sulfurtransferase
VKTLIDEGTPALDVRPPEQFAAGHIPGSINIALSGQFATWAGTILGVTARPVLVADSEEQIEEARVRLSRVGIDAEPGYFSGGMQEWTAGGFSTATMPQMTAQDLRSRREQAPVKILDVRREGEWKAGHIEGAELCPLDQFAHQVPWLDKSVAVAVHCKGGYRSMIACSLLRKAGYEMVTNVIGGFDAWTEAQLPQKTGM